MKISRENAIKVGRKVTMKMSRGNVIKAGTIAGGSLIIGALGIIIANAVNHPSDSPVGPPGTTGPTPDTTGPTTGRLGEAAVNGVVNGFMSSILDNIFDA